MEQKRSCWIAKNAISCIANTVRLLFTVPRLVGGTAAVYINCTQVGIRIILENDVTQWKALELDSDDPDGNNRFIVQHTGQEDPVTGE